MKPKRIFVDVVAAQASLATHNGGDGPLKIPPLLPPFETMEPLLNVFAHFIDDEYDSEEELLQKARCATKEEAKEKLREDYGFYTGTTRAEQISRTFGKKYHQGRHYARYNNGELGNGGLYGFADLMDGLDLLQEQQAALENVLQDEAHNEQADDDLKITAAQVLTQVYNSYLLRTTPGECSDSLTYEAMWYNFQKPALQLHYGVTPTEAARTFNHLKTAVETINAFRNENRDQLGMAKNAAILDVLGRASKIAVDLNSLVEDYFHAAYTKSARIASFNRAMKSCLSNLQQESRIGQDLFEKARSPAHRTFKLSLFINQHKQHVATYAYKKIIADFQTYMKVYDIKIVPLPTKITQNQNYYDAFSVPKLLNEQFTSLVRFKAVENIHLFENLRGLCEYILKKYAKMVGQHNEDSCTRRTYNQLIAICNLIKGEFPDLYASAEKRTQFMEGKEYYNLLMGRRST